MGKTIHSFGLLNRLESQSYTHVGARELPSIDSITYAYTPNGSLQTVIETKATASGVQLEQTHRTFDALERMSSQTRDYGNTQKTTLFTYDTKGNRKLVTDSAGAATVYTFDSVDRLKTATTPNGRAEHFYFVDGLLQRTEYRASAGAAVTTLEKRCYDNASRLTTVASGPPNFMDDACGPMSGVFFSRFDYALDENGNRLTQRERRASTDELTEYGYDDLDRLVATSEPTEAKLYQLDAVGNRIGEKKTTPAAARALGLVAAAFLALAPADTLAHVRGHFNRADWLTQRENLLPAGAPINFLYDANGNTTAENSATSSREYKWDSRNTLTAALVDGLDVGRYSYDWQLQRVSRTAGGSAVEYVLDDKLVLNELDGTHSATRRYHFGAASPLAVADSAGPRFLLNDGLGSVSDEVTPSGALVKQRQYNAWGEYRNSTAPALNEPKLGYEGHQYDPETSLTYARARYLDNRYGKLLSRDSVEGTLSDAPSLHRYNWTRVNPLRFLDFDGLDPFDVARQIQERIAALKGVDPRQVSVHDRPRESAYGLKGPDALIAGYASGPAAGIEAVVNDPGMVGRAAWEMVRPARTREEFMSRGSPLSSVVSGAVHGVQHIGNEWVETVALIDEGADYEAGQRAPIVSTALTIESAVSGTSAVKRGIESSLSPNSVWLKPVGQVAKEGVNAVGSTLESWGQYLPEPRGAAGLSRGGKMPKAERFERYGSKAEAAAAVEEQGLVPRPGHEAQPKWIGEEGTVDPRRLGKSKNYTHKMLIETEPGTKQWLEQNVPDVPEGKYTKVNEPGRYGVPAEKLEEFNERVRKITAKPRKDD